MRSWTTIRSSALAVSIILGVTALALAQTPKAKTGSFQLGPQVLSIPGPDGFEEAASQFEQIKIHFIATEAPDNDMLDVRVLRADCEKLRAGEFGPLSFYTKVSVRRAVRDVDYSAERFANLVATFREKGSQILDINGPAMKGIVEHLDKSLSELSKQNTKIDLSQPVNLGEIDTRPNVYSVILLMNFTTKAGDSEQTVPLLGGLTYMRAGRRLIYVYTYRRYESKADVGILRDFTKKRIGQILAAN